MKLEKLAAIAEIVSSVAIVATLGYLAVQTRQNTLAIQATVRQAMQEDDREILFKQMDYPFVMPGSYSEDSLTDEQRIQLTTWLNVFIRSREIQWLQYRNGVIDEATWVSYSAPLSLVLEPEFARSQWRFIAEGGYIDPGFVAFVNEHLDF
jgi:hypothetical protein